MKVKNKMLDLIEKIKQHAKTPLEIETYIQAWRAIFVRGAMGNQRDYAEARDTRHFIEQERWVPEKDVLKILSGYTVIEKQKLQLNESDPDKYPLFNQRLQQHGYTLYKVTHFEDHDRIHFGNSDIEVSLNLRGKLGLLALDEVIEACMRSLHKKEWIGKVEK